MAKGKFSQPRQPRQDLDDLDTLTPRPAEPKPAPQHDTSLDETQVLTELPFEEEPVAPEEPLFPEEAPSFEEEQFLQETASFQPIPQDEVEPEEEEYYEDDEEDSGYSNSNRQSANKSRKILLVSICAATLLLLIAIIVGVVLFLNGEKDDGLILNNVTVAGVNVGGMTPEQAASAIHRATDLTYTNESMVIKLPDMILELSPADTGAKLDVDAAVEAAYNYGRSGTKAENAQARSESQISSHTIALLPYLNLDLDYIRETLDEYGDSFNSTYEASSYSLEGTMPALDSEHFDKSVSCQTLILNPGSPGRNLDITKIYNAVLDAYSLNTFVVEAEMSAPEEIPEALDLDAIYEELHIDAVDATMDMDTFEVTPETYGYTFDLEKAKSLLEETPYGTSIGIPMEYVVPKVLGADLDGKLFRDELAYYQTAHTSDANRNNNLKLACAAINGYVLNPGETFDYNEVLGERTEKAGYKAAGAINGGESTTEVGGGICQVSSTLYYCTLISDMEIVTRRSHSLVSSYMPMGMDATVSWGGPEFRFKNNKDYPIMIKAEVSDGYVKVWIMGTDEMDYYVKMDYQIVEVLEPKTEEKHYAADNAEGYYDGQVLQNGVTGYTVYSYKYKYDKETNELISKDYEATSNYVRKNKIVVVIDPPETEPTEATTEATTAPTEATTAPTETTAAPTTEAPASTEAPAADASVETTPPATEAPAA